MIGDEAGGERLVARHAIGGGLCWQRKQGRAREERCARAMLVVVRTAVGMRAAGAVVPAVRLPCCIVMRHRAIATGDSSQRAHRQQGQQKKCDEHFELAAHASDASTGISMPATNERRPDTVHL